MRCRTTRPSELATLVWFLFESENAETSSLMDTDDFDNEDEPHHLAYFDTTSTLLDGADVPIAPC